MICPLISPPSFISAVLPTACRATLLSPLPHSPAGLHIASSRYPAIPPTARPPPSLPALSACMSASLRCPC